MKGATLARLRPCLGTTIPCANGRWCSLASRVATTNHPALDAGWTREVRMGTTPALFLARRCTYYAAPRRLGPDRGLGRPAGRRRFENVPAFRFSVILRATTRADMASTLVRTISAALLSVSGGQMGCERPSQRERSYSAASGRCAKRKAALGSPRSRVSGSTRVFCASMLEL